MGIRLAETYKLRSRDWKFQERKIKKKWNLKTLDLRSARKLRNKLNQSRFRSEVWFEELLVKHFSYYKRVIVVKKNFPVLNKYFVDFMLFDGKLAIEIDGSSHIGKEEYDKKRDNLIRKRKIEIVRIRAFDEKAALDCFKFIEKNYLNICVEEEKKPDLPKFQQPSIPKNFAGSFAIPLTAKQALAIKSWKKAGLDLKKMCAMFNIPWREGL